MREIKDFKSKRERRKCIIDIRDNHCKCVEIRDGILYVKKSKRASLDQKMHEGTQLTINLGR